MDKKVKKQWLEALRSGEYKQGREALRNEQNRFCCLGVLCNLHAQAHPEIAQAEEEPEFYLGETGSLPKEVAFWAGLDDNSDRHGIEIELPMFVRASAKADRIDRQTFKRGSTRTLAVLNDEGCNFRQIADIIEAAL